MSTLLFKTSANGHPGTILIDPLHIAFAMAAEGDKTLLHLDLPTFLAQICENEVLLDETFQDVGNRLAEKRHHFNFLTYKDNNAELICNPLKFIYAESVMDKDTDEPYSLVHLKSSWIVPVVETPEVIQQRFGHN